MNLQDKRIITGCDFDTADEGVNKTMARRIENCRVNIVNNGNDGIVEPVVGNTEVVNNLPIGINKTIGSYSDTTNNRIIFFNQNSNESDGIYYFDGLSFTTIVLGDLGWTSDIDIHSITLINNLLTWTEGGNKYPRQVDTNKQYINPTEFDLGLIKTPPTFPLTIVSQSSAAPITNNFYKKNNYYFIYRFVYDNGQPSSWSPYSKMVSSNYTDKLYIQTDSFHSSVNFVVNELRVLKAAGANGLSYNTRIKHIDFAYANTYLGPFKFFKRTKVENVLTGPEWDTVILSDTDLSLIAGDISVNFRNDLSFSVLDSRDTTRPYDEIWPSETIVTADNRNIQGNSLEGFAEFDFNIGNVTQQFKVDSRLVPVANVNLLPGTTPAEVAGNFMVWKNNSNYGLGLVFYNEFGQKSGVYTNQKLAVVTPGDYRKNDGELWTFSFDISGTPPEWATHYQVVRTNNKKVTRFIQGISNDVLYVKSYDADGNPIVIQKKIGFTRGVTETIVNIIRYFPPGSTTPAERRTKVAFAGDDYQRGDNYSSEAIYEQGIDSQNRSLNVQITYWVSVFGSLVRIGESATGSFYPQKTSKVNSFWNAVPDSQNFPQFNPYNGGNSEEPTYEEDYVIGYIPKPASWTPPFNTDGFSSAGNYSGSNGRARLNALGIFGDPIYVGGVNRRGEVVGIFNKDGLDEAIDILIDIYNWNNVTTFEENSRNSASQVAKNVYNASCETPYVFQKGDILNIYYSNDGTYVGITDLEIKELVKGRYLKVKYDKRLLDGDIVGGGAFIEIVTPNTGSDDILFYEYGDCYPVLNSKSSTRYFSKTHFDISEGDTHLMVYAPIQAKNRRINFWDKTTDAFRIGLNYDSYPFFSMNPDNLNRADIWEKANGRPNVVLLDGERQTRRKDTIRYSDRYIDGASINGTSTFYSFNSYQLDYDWGAIRKLTSQEEVILANCEQEAAIIYIKKSMLSNADGSDNLIVSDALLNSAKKLPGGYGCVNPESVNQYNEYIYFWSKLKGCALRYNVFNSIFDISGGYNARSYFYNKESMKCYTGFDPKFRTQYFKFDDENIGFIDPSSQDYPNTWAGFFSFLPEKFAFIQLDMYTFLEGKMYKHETGPINTFYGTKYPSRIKMLFNAEPNMQKIANFISQESDTPLWCESITNQDGQITTIDDGGFERINKDWQADVPGDTSTGLSKWEGDLISSHLFTTTFRYDGDSKFRLRYLNLYSQINQRTNK